MQIQRIDTFVEALPQSRRARRPSRRARQERFCRLIDQFEQDEIGAAVDSLIAMLDERDGDPDVEDDDPAGGDIVDEPHDCDGDEQDHMSSEDCFVPHGFGASGPGCPIADPDQDDSDTELNGDEFDYSDEPYGGPLYR